MMTMAQLAILSEHDADLQRALGASLAAPEASTVKPADNLQARRALRALIDGSDPLPEGGA